MYLLDTCVVSELRRRPCDRAATCLSALDRDQLFLSALTLGQIRRGADLLEEGRRRQELMIWLNGLLSMFASKILPVDAHIAELWGQLSTLAQRRGVQVGAVDQLLAATAIRHGFTLVTRDTEHFAPFGVKLLNPWLT